MWSANRRADRLVVLMRAERLEKSVYPEAWVFRHWPPLLLRQHAVGVQEFEPKDPDYFKVEADIMTETAVEDRPANKGDSVVEKSCKTRRRAQRCTQHSGRC